jgi:selenocysteine lyase/cysteine desulfurase
MITLPYQDFVGMTMSLGLLLEIGVRDIAEVTRAAHEPIVKWAQENGVRITSPIENGHRSAILCIAPAKPVEAYHGMKRARVVCSLREGSIRLSPHCYNTVEEMEKVIEVLDDLNG